VYKKTAHANTIEYSNDPLVWHWSTRNRPVRCSTSLTVYRNTTRNGLTVTDTGLESDTSYKDVFGAHASKHEVNFVSTTTRTTHAHTPLKTIQSESDKIPTLRSCLLIICSR